MSKRNQKKHTLTDGQREILRCLAKEGAQSIFATSKKLRKDYHNTYRMFKILEKKGFIQKFENGYWLTSKGIFSALTDENVKLQPLIRNVEKYKRKDLSGFKALVEIMEKTPVLKRMIGAVVAPLFEQFPTGELERKLSESEMQNVYEAFEGSPFKQLFKEFLKLREEVVKGEEGVKP